MKLLAVLTLSLVLSGCAGVQQKNSDLGGDVGSYRFQLEQAERAYGAAKYDQALDIYRELVRVSPRDAYVHFRMGNSYSRLKLRDKAVASYRKAVQLDAKMSKAWFNMAVTQMQQSSKTWQQMLEFVDADDPLLARAQHYASGMRKLTQREQGDNVQASK
ncbi:MAG: hypothetical protein ACPG4U_10540 [Pseudomonadales bacterium]